MKVPLDGGSPTTIVSNQVTPGTIAVDSTTVYWTTNRAVMKAPLHGGTVITLAADQDAPDAIAVDSASVYWVTKDNPGTVMKATPK